jgi:hypothetical protein
MLVLTVVIAMGAVRRWWTLLFGRKAGIAAGLAAPAAGR